MAEFSLDMADATECAACQSDVPIAVDQCPSCSAPAPFRWNFGDFFGALEQREILDARGGGLIIGRDDAEDDIPMFQFIGNGIFIVVGLMQGGEFIVSAAGTSMFRAELEAINNERGPRVLPLPALNLSQSSSVLNTNLLSPIRGIWIDARGQFIINRHATAQHLRRLEEINDTPWERMTADPGP